MTDANADVRSLRQALLVDTNQGLFQERVKKEARVTKLSRHESASTRAVLSDVRFYEGPEPLLGLPTRLLLERTYGTEPGG